MFGLFCINLLLAAFTIAYSTKYKSLQDKGDKISVTCMLYFFVTAVVRTTDLSELKKQELSVGGKCVNDLCREVCRCVLGKGQPCLECSEYACTLSKVFLWHFSRLVDICKCYVLQKRLQQQTEGSRCKFVNVMCYRRGCSNKQKDAGANL